MNGPLITGAEWRAILHGARVLREVGDDLRRSGAELLAAENHRHAAELEHLSRRSVVAAAGPEAVGEAEDASAGWDPDAEMYEALTGPEADAEFDAYRATGEPTVDLRREHERELERLRAVLFGASHAERRTALPPTEPAPDQDRQAGTEVER